MQTKLNKITRTVTLAAMLSLPVAVHSQSMAGMGGMQGMNGASGMYGMAGMYANPELAQRVEMSRMAVTDFMQTLKGELVAAMKAGGPVNAIQVCNEKAPQIAQAKEQMLGWDLGRVSLKTRNPNNAPDSWETSVLEIFDNMNKLGKNPDMLEYYDVVDAKTGREFRYMRAIPTAEVCTKCHGTDIDPKVAAKLNELYPEDKATGFKVGDLRGAFTIRQPLN